MKFLQVRKNYSTIFKTFDSDIDKASAKIGVFGKSFNEIFEARNKRRLDIDNLMYYEGKTFKEAKKDVDSFWSYLYQKKESFDWKKTVSGEIVNSENINSYIPEITPDRVNTLAEEIAAVQRANGSWTEFYNTLSEGEKKYVVDLVKNTQDLSKVTGDDLVQANQNARQAAIAHNAALKQQTLGAKVATGAMNALKAVGNAIWWMAVMQAITECASWLFNYNDRLEESRQKMIEAGEEASKLTDDLADLVEQYRKLGEDGAFDNSDREQAKNIQEQINQLLGDEVGYIDLTNGKYEEQLKLLKQLQYERALDSHNTKKEAKESAEANIIPLHKDVDWQNWQNDNKKQNDALFNLLAGTKFSKYMEVYEDEDSYSRTRFYLDISSPEAALRSYEDMVELRRLMLQTYDEEINSGGVLEDFYKALDSKIKSMTDSVEKYKEAIANYDLNEAVIKFNQTDFGGFKGALIESEEQLKLWMSAMLDSEDVSDSVKANLVGLAKTHFPNFTAAIDESTDAYFRNQLSSINAQNVSDGLIGKLQALGVQCGYTEYDFNELILEIGIFNNQNLDVAGKIQALQELGYFASLTAAEIAKIQGGTVKRVKVGGKDIIATYDKDGKLTYTEEIEPYAEGNKGILGNSKTQPDNSKTQSDNNKTHPDNSKENKALEALKANLEARKQVIERYKEFVELTDFGIDLAEEDDFGLKSELLSGKISQLTSYGEAMREEFDRIANTIPKTGDQADALASRLQELGSNMRSNITEIRKTQMELQKLSIDMASTLIEDRMEELNSQLDDIDRQINILNSDYKNDYSHVSNMLSMNMLLPSYSDFGGLRSKNSNANRELIRSEQETQDTINDIIETQIKKNEDLRESERQAILADMATMRNEVQIHLNDVNEDYVSSWRTSQNITDSGVMGIENAINNMDMKIPEPDISNVVKACELVKEMLDNMGDAEYTPPKIKVSDGIDGGDDSKDIISGNKANIVSNIAKNQLGVPYVWGGVAPGIGLDCSGLTQYAYRVAGVSLPRRSQEQWSCGIGKRIDWADLKKGDQLFFGSGDEATHTGIYVGNGQMIHAPHTGDVVKYSSINTEYYQGRFLGAKRYAAGTPKGNALAKDLGIAGENYKPEILIDKATGRATYIDKPTIIDTSKTDVVGEKATARMPKFADGTLDPDTMIDTIEGFYNQVNDEIGKISAKYAKEYVDILHNPKLSDFDKSEKLYDIQYLMGQENSAIGEDIYNRLNAEFYQWLKDVENGDADWSLEIYEAFTSTLDNIIEKSYDMVNKAVESKTAAADMRWENSNSWIEDRNYYKDWDLFTDSEINAWERVVKWLKKEFPKELDKIKEAERNLFEARKKEFEKTNNLADSYLNSQKTLLQSYFEVTNSIAEARHEINKDLKASMTMYEYLDEKTRILLFNQDDYNRLSKELYDIEDKALKLKQNYEEDLDNATLDTIESITSEYEMQYKTLMKSYEIAKADLEITKKKAQLNNVLNERNVRMFVNGQWMWVANTEDVVNAQNELADAVHDKNVAETGLEQQNSLNTITRSQNELNVVIKEFESGVIDLDEAVELAKGAIGELPRTLRYMFYKIGATSLPSNNAQSSNYIHDYDEGLANVYRANDYSLGVYAALEKGDIKEALRINESRNKKIDYLGLDTDKWDEEYIRRMMEGYADGTRYTKSGKALMGEEGFEAYIDSSGHLVPISRLTIADVSGGGVVFNTEQMSNLRNLWDMSNFNLGVDKGFLDRISQQNIQTYDNRIIINGMTVDTGSTAGKNLVDALQRYVSIN